MSQEPTSPHLSESPVPWHVAPLGEPSGSSLVDEVADWLMSQALGEHTVEEIVEGCSQRLLAAGVPLTRSWVGFRTIHPLFASVTLIWRRGEGVGTMQHLHGEAFTSRQWRESPFQHMLDTGIPYIRRPLTGARALTDFPVLDEFRAAGATDYLAYTVSFDNGGGEDLAVPGLLGSWTTDRAGGFTDRDIRSLLRIQRRLAVACKMTIKDQIARNILSAYLGESAGRQVMQGRIKRGDGERIHAVIWFSDLRDSTRLAESRPLDEFLGMLNAFFEAIAGAVIDNGGEVLRFIGDAVSGIFPIEPCDLADPTQCPAHRAACETALGAARDAISRMQTLNAARVERGEAPLACGIALHVGDVMYGNIGAPGRLEFSVTGPAANQAARMERLCKVLDTPLVVSADFASILPEPWESLGSHALEGVDGAQPVFRPCEEARATEAPSSPPPPPASGTR